MPELDVIHEALSAAKIATDDMVNNNPNQWYPCGFAMIRLRPARGRFVDAMKHLSLGRSDDYEGGYIFANPGKNNTQWMDAKIEGAKAFVHVVKKHFPDINIRVESRID